MYRILVSYQLDGAGRGGATLSVLEADEGFDKCVLYNGKEDVGAVWLEDHDGWDTLEEDVQTRLAQARWEIEMRRNLQANTPGPHTYVI